MILFVSSNFAVSAANEDENSAPLVIPDECQYEIVPHSDKETPGIVRGWYHRFLAKVRAVLPTEHLISWLNKEASVDFRDPHNLALVAHSLSLRAHMPGFDQFYGDLFHAVFKSNNDPFTISRWLNETGFRRFVSNLEDVVETDTEWITSTETSFNSFGITLPGTTDVSKMKYILIDSFIGTNDRGLVQGNDRFGGSVESTSFDLEYGDHLYLIVNAAKATKENLTRIKNILLKFSPRNEQAWDDSQTNIAQLSTLVKEGLLDSFLIVMDGRTTHIKGSGKRHLYYEDDGFSGYSGSSYGFTPNRQALISWLFSQRLGKIFEGQKDLLSRTPEEDIRALTEQE